MSIGLDPIAALGPALSTGGMREPADVDMVGGTMPRVVVSPGSEEEVAATLRACSAAGLAVVPRGAGTTLDWGAPVERCDVVLSTERLDALVEHEPGDLVCVVQAGMPLARLQEILRPAGQRLMLDPPRGAGSTLGGVLATAASGPLRQRYGSFRDLCIGARFVAADGTVGHSGGKVVKNVAGYDVAKALVGSLGTLAVVTEIAVRLHPLAQASCSVAVEGVSAARLARFAAGVDSLGVDAACVEVLWPEASAVARLEGTAEGTRRRADALVEATGARLLAEAEAEALWTGLRRRPWEGAGVVAGLAFPRSRLAEVVALCATCAEEVSLRAGIGVGEARLGADATTVARLRSQMEGLGGRVVLHRCPPELGALAWPGAGGVELELMRSLKASLDPAGRLSPGRMVGGI